MAIVKTSGLVSDIRGKLGGVCFQKSSGGLMLRTMTKPKNKRTNSQELQRATMAQVQNEWRDITNGERDKYKSLATLAQVRQNNITKNIINGHQLFIKVNTLLLRYGEAVVTSTKLNQSLIVPIECTVALTLGVLEISTNRAIVYGNEILVFYMSGIIANSVNRNRNRSRMIVFQNVSSNKFDITAPYLAIFGVLPATDDQVFIKYFVVGKKTALLGSQVREKIIIG
tara:strand:+ start:199 stop:879 length:681 start_codon:yes stop_codon:yes gene_type:complete